MLLGLALTACLSAAPAVAAPALEVAPAAPADAEEPGVSLSRRLLAGTVAGVGAGASLLLSFPLSLPLLYLAPVIGLSPLIGVLAVAAVVPIALAVGSGVAASAFHPGIGPYAVGGAAAFVGGVVALLTAAAVQPVLSPPEGPDSTRPEFHLSVLSLLGVPTLAAAGAAFVVAPFFVAPPKADNDIE
jgi:hypothetical protein